MEENENRKVYAKYFDGAFWDPDFLDELERDLPEGFEEKKEWSAQDCRVWISKKHLAEVDYDGGDIKIYKYKNLDAFEESMEDNRKYFGDREDRHS
jgi:hypothetical protein